jgi:hypothetical protein
MKYSRKETFFTSEQKREITAAKIMVFISRQK